MKRLLLVLVTASGAALLGACGSGEVIVQAQTAGDPAAGTDAQALSDLVIQLLPYDRDQVFDSLQNAYPEPEPAIPDSLLALQETIAEAQVVWREAEAEWNQVRDSLKGLTDRMDAMGPAGRTKPEYRGMFQAFSALEPEEGALRRQMDAAFKRFTDLQSQFTSGTREIKLLREQWADDAFAGVDSVIYVRLQALELEELADTTDATGAARFLKVSPGQWWVYARYDLPYNEMYWNIPVDVTKGEPIRIQLTRENARLRPKL